MEQHQHPTPRADNPGTPGEHPGELYNRQPTGDYHQQTHPRETTTNRSKGEKQQRGSKQKASAGGEIKKDAKPEGEKRRRKNKGAREGREEEREKGNKRMGGTGIKF